MADSPRMSSNSGEMNFMLALATIVTMFFTLISGDTFWDGLIGATMLGLFVVGVVKGLDAFLNWLDRRDRQ